MVPSSPSSLARFPDDDGPDFTRVGIEPNAYRPLQLLLAAPRQIFASASETLRE